MIFVQALTVSPSPHINKKITTQKIMGLVLIALLPSVIAAGIFFGARALLVIAISTFVCVLAEYISRIVMKRDNTTSDLSAAVTGVILALNVPSTIPFWILIVGDLVAIVIVKQLFGGLGQNFANPAIVARVFLVLSFGTAMTAWIKPNFGQEIVDSATYATPLAQGVRADYLDMFLGNIGGCLGETSALALLIGGIFLVATKVISPMIPVSFISSLAIMSWIFGGDPLYAILSGGVMLGAIFMATDYVTSPISKSGKLVFGIGCGVLTFIIRKGPMPEGVSFAILLMNLIVPYIDMLCKSKAVGAKNAEVSKNKKIIKASVLSVLGVIVTVSLTFAYINSHKVTELCKVSKDIFGGGNFYQIYDVNKDRADLEDASENILYIAENRKTFDSALETKCGDDSLIVAISSDGKIEGVKLLKDSNSTDLDKFAGADLSADFTKLTDDTAISDSVKEACEFYTQFKGELLYE